MPITCNAVGDLLALIELAIKVADTLNEARKAPAECPALLSELRALQSLVELSRPMIATPADETLRNLLDERLYAVAQRILDGLALVVDLDIAQDPARASTNAQHNGTRKFKSWIRRARQSVQFVLKTNASARECREAISQGFTSLIYALLVVVHDDHRQFIRTVAEAHDKMTVELQRLADTTSAGQERMLQESDAVLDAQFKLLRSVEEVRKQMSELGVLERESTTAIRNDIAEMATNLERGRRTAVDDIIRSQAAIVQCVTETVSNERAATREGYEAVTAREHADTRRHITAMRAFNAKDLAATTGATIGAVRSENDETRTQVLAAVSGLGLTIRNGVDEDRAQRARMEANLGELVRLLEAVAGIVDVIRRVRSLNFQQRCLGWQPAMLLTDAPVTITSRDVIIGATILAFTAQQGHTRLSCAAMAVAFMVWRQVCGVMYSVPTLHVIYVLDFFDSRIGIPLEEATSSETMHRALARRANTMGLVLIQMMHYEIRPAGSAEPLPPTWNDALTPGGEVLLNARVQNKANGTQAICPTCSTNITNYGSPPPASSAWITCPHCPMQVLVSTSDGPRMSQHPSSGVEEIDAAPISVSSTSELPSSTPIFSVESVLKQCKRVHFIAQRLPDTGQSPVKKRKTQTGFIILRPSTNGASLRVAASSASSFSDALDALRHRALPPESAGEGLDGDDGDDGWMGVLGAEKTLYVCPFDGCGRKYTFASNLRRHMRRKHGLAEAESHGGARSSAEGSSSASGEGDHIEGDDGDESQ